MAISVGLHAKAKTLSSGVEVGPFRAVADAVEVIPRTLVQNAGGNVMRGVTELRVSCLFPYFLFLFFLPFFPFFPPSEYPPSLRPFTSTIQRQEKKLNRNGMMTG